MSYESTGLLIVSYVSVSLWFGSHVSLHTAQILQMKKITAFDNAYIPKYIIKFIFHILLTKKKPLYLER